MIDHLQRELDDIEELMKYRSYQPAIDKITEVLEVRLIFWHRIWDPSPFIKNNLKLSCRFVSPIKFQLLPSSKFHGMQDCAN